MQVGRILKILFVPSTALPHADWTNYTARLCKYVQPLDPPDPMNSCRQLDLDALIAAVRALEALAHERTVARLKQESDDLVPPSHDGHPYTLPYDPASVFLLETMISISCQAPQHIEYLWFVLRSIPRTNRVDDFPPLGPSFSSTCRPCFLLRHNIVCFSLSGLLSACCASA